jgi:salicylate hydroxylase
MGALDGPPVLVAGGGVAGMTAAIAFGRLGIPVHLYERNDAAQEIGAGLQLSPNATRILRDLGVLDRLSPAAVRPPAIVLRDARTFLEIGRVALGDWAQRRWGAPYLVAHRADLQQALHGIAEALDAVTIVHGSPVTALQSEADGVVARLGTAGGDHAVRGRIGIAADGVWSRLRVGPDGGLLARFAGHVAWRRLVAAGGSADALVPGLSVGAHLSPKFHLVAYPIRAGAQINIVAFTRGGPLEEKWSAPADPDRLFRHLTGSAPAIAGLADDPGLWSAFPIHVVPEAARWTNGRVALIGDAAHAMTPFAAQGAAMAIEDAWTLARSVLAADNDADALRSWEAQRRPRLARVRRRGALNALAWHAGGPTAMARNLVLAMSSPQRLSAGLDWLYGAEPG